MQVSKGQWGRQHRTAPGEVWGLFPPSGPEVGAGRRPGCLPRAGPPFLKSRPGGARQGGGPSLPGGARRMHPPWLLEPGLLAFGAPVTRWARGASCPLPPTSTPSSTPSSSRGPRAIFRLFLAQLSCKCRRWTEGRGPHLPSCPLPSRGPGFLGTLGTPTLEGKQHQTPEVQDPMDSQDPTQRPHGGAKIHARAGTQPQTHTPGGTLGCAHPWAQRPAHQQARHTDSETRSVCTDSHSPLPGL